MSDSPNVPLSAARSLLFVPGSRADRFDKAVAAGPDAVVIDLEDAVAPQDKAAARAGVDAWLAAGGRAVVRVNGAGTEWFEDDLAMAAAHGVPLVLPKAEDPAVLSLIAERTGGAARVVALVETAAGVENAPQLCRAPGVVRLALGNVDLAAQLGVDPADQQALLYCRSRLVLSSASAALAAPVDGVTTDLTEETGAAALADGVAHARRLGFTGKFCLHPRQIAAVRAGFTPSAREREWARRIVAAAPTGTELVVVDGEMVDRPVWERARRILASAQASGSAQAPNSAQASGRAQASGSAQASGWAQASGSAQASGWAQASGSAQVGTLSAPSAAAQAR